MTLQTWIVFFLLNSSLYASVKQAVNHEVWDTEVDKVVSGSQTSLTKKDKIDASNIISIYKSLRRDQVHLDKLSSVMKSLNNTSSFNHFSPILQSIKNVAKVKNSNSLYLNCSSMIQQQYQDKTLSVFHMQSVKFCIDKYLDSLIDRSKKGLTIRQHIQSKIPTLLSKTFHLNFDNQLSNLLDVLVKNNTREYILFSTQLANLYIAKNKVPSHKILEAIYITADLTRFVQLKGFDQNSVRTIINQELKTMVSDSFHKADKSINENEVLLSVQKVINFTRLNLNYIGRNSAAKTVVSLGKSLLRRQYFSSSRLLFESVSKFKSRYQEEALFNILWTDISRDRYAAAIKTVKKFKLDDNYKMIKSSKLMFWTAEVISHESKRKSEQLLTYLVKNDPLNFYSVMAAKRLKKSNNSSSELIFKQELTQNHIPYHVKLSHFSNNILSSLRRLRAWADYGYAPFITYEFDSLSNYYIKELVIPKKHQNTVSQKFILTQVAARLLSLEKHYLQSFKIVYNQLRKGSLSLNYNLLGSLFPKPYLNQINKQIHTFDPVIVLSLIRQESGFNPRARSHVGARGLMQLMPATARQIQTRVRTSQLYNPNINLDIGIKYFEMLLNKYEHNLVYTLSAYNAGEGRVKKWRKEYLTSDSILKNIENIPFNETKKYVKLIFRNIFFYKLLNEKNNVADNNAVNKLFDIKLGFND